MSSIQLKTYTHTHESTIEPHPSRELPCLQDVVRAVAGPLPRLEARDGEVCDHLQPSLVAVRAHQLRKLEIGF